MYVLIEIGIADNIFRFCCRIIDYLAPESPMDADDDLLLELLFKMWPGPIPHYQHSTSIPNAYKQIRISASLLNHEILGYLSHESENTKKIFKCHKIINNNYKNTLTSGDENYVSFGLRAFPKNVNNVTLFRYYRKLWTIGLIFNHMTAFI